MSKSIYGHELTPDAGSEPCQTPTLPEQSRNVIEEIQEHRTFIETPVKNSDGCYPNQMPN